MQSRRHPLSWQVLQVCMSLRNPVLVELIQGQCLIMMRKMQSPLCVRHLASSQLITVLEVQTLKSRKRTELHQDQGHIQVRGIPEHHREVWGLVDPNLPRHRVLPQGQGHRQVEDIHGNTPLKRRVDVTAKGQVQSLGQDHTQVQCRGQDQSSAIQGRLRKKLRRKRNMILRHQLQDQGQLNIVQENLTQKLRIKRNKILQGQIPVQSQ